MIKRLKIERVIKIDKLGSNIKKFRNIKKLSLKDLANEIDVSPSMLSQIESGKANPSLNTLKLISKHLDVSMFTLLEEENEEAAMLVKKENIIRITSGRSDSYE